MAWHPLGWEPAFFSEIEAAPRAVLSHHYPHVPLHGDFTTIGAEEYGPIDLLVGGTPCQSFSVAGLRGGLADDRGNLALEFLKLVDRRRPRWVVWENVPGVFSSLSHDAPDFRPPEIDLDSGDGPEDGEEVVVEDRYDTDESHALACFLAGLSELGYGWSYRVLDAQFAGVPQRRRRIFVIGYLGDWRRAAAVLFERHSLSGNPPPRREAGEKVAGTLRAGSGGGCRPGPDEAKQGLLISAAYGGNNTAGPIDVATALNAHGGPAGRMDFESETFIAFNITPSNSNKDFNARASQRAQALTVGGNRPSARGGDLICFSAKDHGADASDIAPTLRAGGHSGSHANAAVMPAIAFQQQGSNVGACGDLTGTLPAGNGNESGGVPCIATSTVRRLTPRECERLQGFPDDFTLVPHRDKPMADGPRYKMLGNSKAVPVVRWIGSRIQAVEEYVAAIDAEARAA